MCSRSGVGPWYACVLCALMLVLGASLVAGCGAPAKVPLTISEVKLTKEDLPDWKLTEVKATRENAAPKSVVEQLYDEGAVDILNQTFIKDGKKIQVNYVQMPDLEKGRWAESILEAAVGGTNYIGHKDNIAIEIIGDTPEMTIAAEKLNLSL